MAMTRARDFLYVLWPLRYYHKWSKVTDNHSYAQLCRFFTDEVTGTMDCHTPVSPARPGEAGPSTIHTNILSKIKDMWE